MGHHAEVRRPSTRALLAPLLVLGTTLATLLGVLSAAPASATAHHHGARKAAAAALSTGEPVDTNPLAGRTWGVYKGPGDQAWAPYVRSRGANRALLAKIALRPKAKWFGAWIGNSEIQSKVRSYIANSTGGNPDVLVQLTVFRMVPWEHDACRRLPSAREQSSYKQWIDRFAAGIGNAHVALILQPDGPFALCVPHGSSLPSTLIGYSAQKFSALKNTSVYIDGGASDWPAGHPDTSAKILAAAGVKYARGFALDSTHYVSTGSDIDYGNAVISRLTTMGIPGKHFVINTSSNGQPFTFDRARGSNPDNAKACATKSERVCVTLGIPPTTDVANVAWRLTSNQRSRATEYVDGYLWFGRPWLHNQADPFDLGRALALARTTPY